MSTLSSPVAKVQPNDDVESGNATRMPLATQAPVRAEPLIVNAQVVPAADPNRDENAYEREKVLLELYQTSRIIRVVSIIDIVFIVVFGLFSPIFFGLLPFPLCGYFGAKKWMYRVLFVYCMYLILEIIGGIISCIFITGPVFLALRILYIIFNIVIARYATRLCSFMLVFEEGDFVFLRTSPVIQSVEKTLLC